MDSLAGPLALGDSALRRLGTPHHGACFQRESLKLDMVLRGGQWEAALRRAALLWRGGQASAACLITKHGFALTQGHLCNGHLLMPGACFWGLDLENAHRRECFYVSLRLASHSILFQESLFHISVAPGVGQCLAPQQAWQRLLNLMSDWGCPGSFW